ncbi:hypothetical protein M3Y97_00586300 [Aphelenchoides bicaudatus]|nr:hypothetical protein M3Y97_00586300 [Aphelenchoides bicaudatus]
MVKKVTIQQKIKRYSISERAQFQYMLCLIAIVVIVSVTLILLIGGSVFFCISDYSQKNHAQEIHVRPAERSLKSAKEEFLFKKLHGYRYWDLRQKSAREAISSILPLFKEKSLELDRPFNSSIFSPTLFSTGELKTPNSPDTLSTNDAPV